jgi:hypothetical protein
MTELSTAGWMVKRWLPAMVLAVVFGAAVGVFRGVVAFVPGIQGMLALGVLGYAVGRLGRGDPERFWSFGQRIWIALGCALVLGVVQVLVVSVLKAGPYDSAFEWLGNVVDGQLVEGGAGLSRSGPAARGHALRLSGGSWVFFTLLDVLLGAFVFVATTIGGLGARRAAEEVAGPALCPGCGRPVAAEGRYCAGCGRELPPSESAPADRGSRAALALFVVLLAFCGLSVGAFWLWDRQANQTEVLSLDNLHRNQRLIGGWELSGGDGLDAIPAGQRRLAAKLLGMDEIALVPEDEHAFLISLRPLGRARTRFEGRLDPGRGFAWFRLPSTFGFPLMLSVEAQASADDRTLRLVIERQTGDKRVFSLRRMD